MVIDGNWTYSADHPTLSGGRHPGRVGGGGAREGASSPSCAAVAAAAAAAAVCVCGGIPLCVCMGGICTQRSTYLPRVGGCACLVGSGPQRLRGICPIQPAAWLGGPCGCSPPPSSPCRQAALPACMALMGDGCRLACSAWPAGSSIHACMAVAWRLALPLVLHCIRLPLPLPLRRRRRQHQQLH